MKKTFPLASERHKPARVAEQVRAEVKKYLKRERSKKLDEELYDYWGFDCRAGRSAAESADCHVKELGKFLDEAVDGAWPEIYLEILAKPMKREVR